jgi:hypothetical protein
MQRTLTSLFALLSLLLVSSWASAQTFFPDGRKRVQEVLKANTDFEASDNTVVYVLGGNFDYGPLQGKPGIWQKIPVLKRLGYMNPARKAAQRLGIEQVESSANPNGSAESNAKAIQQDLVELLKARPGVKIVFALNSKGYRDLKAAMVDAPEEIRAAEGRMVGFALSPNNGGTNLAQKVLDHPTVEKVTKALLSRARSPWNQGEGLASVTPEASRAADASYAGRHQINVPIVEATTHLGKKGDLILSVKSQVVPDAAERWDLARATHGSFTMAGFKNSRSTRLHMAGIIQASKLLPPPRVATSRPGR